MNLRSIYFILFVILVSCGGNDYYSKFPLKKTYWDQDDYKLVNRLIQYQTPNGERFPEFKNVKNAQIINKLTDQQNFLVLLTDEQLGLNHRNNVASSFFEESRKMSKMYSATDIQDKFQYGMEYVEILKFGLELQIHYFKLGNDNIIKQSDDPNDSDVQRLTTSNIKTLFENFNYYLDLINKENAFDQDQLTAYIDGINKYFPILFETFPNGNLSITKNKTNLMLKKASNPELKKSLEQLILIIETFENKND